MQLLVVERQVDLVAEESERARSSKDAAKSSDGAVMSCYVDYVEIDWEYSEGQAVRRLAIELA